MRWLLLLLLGYGTVWGASLSERIDEIARNSEVARRGFWGAQVADLETGAIIYQNHADKLFIPASNVKIFSTALALMRLGPDHRFRTLILADTEPDAEGVVAGDLRFFGGGDPTLSARKVPYVEGPIKGDPLGPLKALADELVAKGLRRVDGDVVGDDSAYLREPYPEGWAEEDTAWEYGAPVSALTLHDNAFKISVFAAKTRGGPARLFVKPPVEYYTIDNHVRTVSKGEARVEVEWPAGARELHLYGQVTPRMARAKLLAIRNPAHYAAWALARALRERGVEIRGEVRAEHLWRHEVESETRAAESREPEGVVLVERTSPPLFEVLKIINKVSQNLHAELVLREVGRVRRNIGSRAAGLEELKSFLAEAGVAPDSYHFEDASGLSRMNLATPAAAVKLLTYMYLSTERDGWLDLLAIGGEEGTLHYRFRSAATRGRIIAKTGTLTGAAALSGYAQTSSGRMLVFSVMVNNYNTRSRPARQFIDRIVAALLSL